MIKEVEISYPGFGLDLGLKFKKGINVLEGPNGYGKTTVINTIHSMMTGNYPGARVNPKGTAKITTDVNPNLMINGSWTGTYPQDPKITYAFPGKFFEIKGTPSRRKALIELLDIDYEKFMGEHIGELGEDYDMLMQYEEKELKAMVKDGESKEEILLEDIMKYKTFIKEFNDENYDDVIFYLKNKDILISKIMDHNMKNSGAGIDEKKRIINYDITTYEKDLVELRTEYMELSSNTKCPTCDTTLKAKPTAALNKIKEKADAIKTKIEFARKNLKQVEDTRKPFVKLGIEGHELWESAKELGIDFKDVSQARLDHWEEYKHQMSKVSIYREDLKVKEKQLEELNTEVIKDCLVKLDEIKKKFTVYLKKKTDGLPLNIELFKRMKNGNINTTFDLLDDDGLSYNDMSMGNKMIMEIKLAEVYADKYKVDTMCIDEGSIISKNNLSYIKELSKRKQVIIVKATGWDSKDFK